MSEYFDDSEFNENPVKTEVITDYYSLDPERSFVQNIYYRKNVLNLKDFWFSWYLYGKTY